MNAKKAKQMRREARTQGTATLDLKSRPGRKELHRRQDLLRAKIAADKKKAEMERWNALTPEQKEEEQRKNAADNDATRRRVMGLMGMIGTLTAAHGLPDVQSVRRQPFQRGR